MSPDTPSVKQTIEDMRATYECLFGEQVTV
jgi:hypothetical protein